LTQRPQERDELLEQLSAARRDFANLVASSADAILVIDDEDGRIRHANPAAETLFGAGRGELLGRHFGSPETSGGPVELEIPQEGGATFTVEVRASPVSGRGHQARVVTFRDVTERKFLAEAREVALAVAKRRAFEATAYAQGARLVLEATSLDACMEQLFASCRELLGAQAGYVFLVEGERNLAMQTGDRPCSVASPPERDGLHARAARIRRVQVDNDFAARELPPGHIGIDNVLIAPMVLDGEMLGLLKLANKPGGFTEQDQRIAAGFAELAAIALSKSRLEASLTRADRLASLGTVAAGIAHEINNPLAWVLLNLAELAEELAGVPATAKLAGLAADATLGVRRIREIVRGLTSFSRVESGRLERLDIGRSVQAALEMARSEIEHRARLIDDLQPLPPVLATQGRLTQVFLNLLINAAQAIDPGGSPDDAIRLRSWADEGFAVVEVSDTGHGIAERHLPHLFEPCFSTRAPGEGSGLGLAVSHGIVTDLGGDIEVESEAGRGARFRVRIPLAPARAPA